MAEHTLFAKLVNLFKNLSATPKKKEKTQLLETFLGDLQAEEIPPSVLLILGQIFPASDARTLNVSEGTVRKVISRIQERTPHPEPLTILAVHRTFCEMAEVTGSGSRQKKEELLEGLFGRVSTLEAEYLVRIIFGEMRHGVAKGVMIQAIAQIADTSLKRAQRAAMFIGDLGELAQIACLKGKAGLEAIDLTLFQPIEPMLAALAKNIKQVLADHGGESALEYKYDGARVQIHKKGDEVAIFSRLLSNVTASLPEVVDFIETVVTADEAIWRRRLPESKTAQARLLSYPLPITCGSFQVREFGS